MDMLSEYEHFRPGAKNSTIFGNSPTRRWCRFVFLRFKQTEHSEDSFRPLPQSLHRLTNRSYARDELQRVYQARRSAQALTLTLALCYQTWTRMNKRKSLPASSPIQKPTFSVRKTNEVTHTRCLFVHNPTPAAGDGFTKWTADR